MKFHDICSYENGLFQNFDNELLNLPTFDQFRDKLKFVSGNTFNGRTEDDKTDTYSCTTYQVQNELPDAIKTSLLAMIDSRRDFFNVVRYIFGSMVSNKILYFHSFGLKTAIIVPDDVDVKSLTEEELNKLEKKVILIIHGAPKHEKDTETTPLVVIDKKE